MIDLGRVGPAGAVRALLAAIPLALGSGRLRGQLAVLLLVNAAFYAAVLAGLVALALWATAPLAGHERAALVALGWVVRVASVVGAVLLSPALFQVASAVALVALRERLFLAAREVAGAPPAPPLGRGALARVALTEARRLVRLLVVSALLLPLHLVPGIGSVLYVALQVAVAAHALGWDLLSFHFELHDIPYAEQRRALARARPTVLALGGAATLLALVPVAQVFFLTTNVVGAGLLSARLDGAR